MPTTTLDAGALGRDVRHVFRFHKELAERALAQVDDAAFLADPGGGVDPLALAVKHVGGNLRSRWRDFLTSDGEKPERHRDREFELEPGDDRASLTALWEAGWGELFGALEALSPEDWSAEVAIRGEPHTVPQAVLRSLAHTSYHVGQIVLLAKRAAGPGWRTLSIPRGGSELFRVRPVEYLNPHEADPGNH